MKSQCFVALSTGRWTVELDDRVGFTCETPAIVILPKLPKSREYLNTVLHETLHATLPKISEKEVVRIAHDLTMVLWQIGYRNLRGQHE